MNIVQIAGRLGRDAETRFTPSGLKVTTLTVATNIRRGGKEETVWWRVTLWGDRFDKILPYLKKGSAIIVIGEMGKPEIWTDKDGKSHVNLEVHADIVRFNPFGGSGERSGEQANATTSQQQNQSYGSTGDSQMSTNSFAEDSFGFQSYGAQKGQSEEHAFSQHSEGDNLPF